MAKLTVWKKALCLLSLLPATALQAQNTSSPKQTDGWFVGMGTGASFGIKPTENTLFRANSMATKMFGQYYFGHVGLGFSTGIVPGSISSTAVNQFLTERKFPIDAVQASSKPLNAYLLFGPAVSFGRQVKISAGINGGIFYNNPGSLTISQQGVTRPLYRFEADNKNISAGLSGTISLAYPINTATRFFINSDYLQTQSGIRLTDPQRGIDVATSQTRTVKLFTAGAGIIKSLGSVRDHGSGMSTGKRNVVQAGQQETTRDAGSGMATGKRSFSPRDQSSGIPTGKRIVTPRDPASGMATGKRSATAGGDNAQSCGPVTLKTTNADGSSSEQTFSCPADALNYKRQTQGSSFGEKVNAGLHAAGGALAQGASRQKIIHRDIAARNILLGRISWTGNSVPGIVTNQDAVSSVGGSGGSGAAAASYARTAATGIQTTIHTRDAGSGMATGRRQYQPAFFEGNGTGTNCENCAASVIVNPLYVDKGNQGVNPMNKSQNTTTGTTTSVEDLKVYLVDAASGTAVAVTQTEANGDFWFANVPSGDYVVQVTGYFLSKKGYDVYLKNKGSYDVAGEMLLADDFWSVTLETAEGTAQQAAAVIKTKTKSNQSNDRMAANPNEEPLVWSPRSNKTMPTSLADVDGDGVSEIVAGASLLGGALPGGAVISAAMRPGTPIGGIIVKGGKNPGGNLRTVTSNEYGEFEFTGWAEGNYTISADINYIINDETFISIGNDFNDDNSSLKTTVPKQTQGTTFGEKVNAGLQANNGGMPNRISMNVTVPKQTQGASFGEKSGINSINNNGMPNRISMNVTVPKQTQGATFGEKVNSGRDNNPTTRAQNNNTVRSNRTDNAIVIADLDGDGEMESSYLNFNGEVAVINIAPPANGKVVEKATSGLKDVIRTQVRMAAPVGPVKWMAPELNATQIWGDPHVDEKDGTRLVLNNGGQVVNEGKWKTIPVTVKAVTCADGSCAIITAAPGDFSSNSTIALRNLPAEPVAGAAVWFTDAKGTIYKTTTDENGTINLNELPTASSLSMLVNFGVAAGDDIIISFSTDANGRSVSNVLKTKHDTAKNSIGNIR